MFSNHNEILGDLKTLFIDTQDMELEISVRNQCKSDFLDILSFIGNIDIDKLEIEQDIQFNNKEI